MNLSVKLSALMAVVGAASACGELDDLLHPKQAEARCQTQDAARGPVREMIRKLMDEPRQVPASQGHPAETRGGPGGFAKLQPAQVEEFVSAILDGGELFFPKSLPAEHKAALIAAEISAESAFQPGTSGLNPNPVFGNSVGPLQNTTSIWVPLFKQYGQVPGLHHYDGSPWNPADTTDAMMQTSIYDNILCSLWAITIQGRRGAPDWLGGPDGPAAKTVWTGQFSWVAGAGAAAKNDDPTLQRDHYRNMLEADLKLLGLPGTLLDTPF